MTGSFNKVEKKAFVTEIFVWRDGSESSVRCTFHNGKLAAFELTRPVQDELSSDGGEPRDPKGS